MSVTKLMNRYINDHLYEWAYDEAINRFKLEQFFDGREWPEDQKITVRRALHVNRLSESA